MSDTKHGWVSPRADGQRARCGGPGICTTCNTEAMHEKMLTGLFGAPMAPSPAPMEQAATASTHWKPIETAPKDNKRALYLVRFDSDGNLAEIDFDGSWEYWVESWELAHINGYYWTSANGIEEPTHWAYQDEPIPCAHVPPAADEANAKNNAAVRAAPAAPVSTVEQDERQAFEAWGLAGCEMVDDPQSMRMDIARHCAWEAWQARARIDAPAAADAQLLAALKQAHMALIGFMPQHRNAVIVNAIVAAREAIDSAEAAQRKGDA
ncbi:hypothetical protein [Achromobacter xylosoxidans]|uniref:hypothetical protein n=1 Tax=Alcaligenes xylosoxydans xylosoxydans TaxID=85698 RepID=UPI001EECE4F4|nr:hypothetical protein [Achromobacter xylosoxidans]